MCEHNNNNSFSNGNSVMNKGEPGESALYILTRERESSWATLKPQKQQTHFFYQTHFCSLQCRFCIVVVVVLYIVFLIGFKFWTNCAENEIVSSFNHADETVSCSSKGVWYYNLLKSRHAHVVVVVHCSDYLCSLGDHWQVSSSHLLLFYLYACQKGLTTTRLIPPIYPIKSSFTIYNTTATSL